MMRDLHLNAIHSKANKAIVRKVQTKVNDRILAETVMRWKIFKLQKSTALISIETSQDHYETKLKEKAIIAFSSNQNV